MIVIYILLIVLLAILTLISALLLLPIRVKGFHEYNGKINSYNARVYLLLGILEVYIEPSSGKNISYEVFLFGIRVYKGISKKEEKKKKKVPEEKAAEKEIPEKEKKKKAPKIVLKDREKFWLVYDYVRKYRKHVLRLFKFKLLKWDFKASLGDYFNTGLAYAIYWFLNLPSKGVYFFPVFNGNGKNGGNVSLMYEGEINASFTLFMHRMWWLGIRLSLDEGLRRYFPYANRKRVQRWRKKLDKSKTGTYYTPIYGPLAFELPEKREPGHYYTTTYHDKGYYKKRWEEKARSLS